MPFFARGSAAALRTLELGASTGTGALVRAIAKSPKAALLEHLSLDPQELAAAELALYD